MNDEKNQNKEEEELSTDKLAFVDWIKVHKKQLALAGLSISTLILIVLGIRNKETIKELWNGLKKSIDEANLYSSKWFEKVTDQTLNAEREKIRLAYCSSSSDFAESIRLENLLNRIDREISKRAWNGETPHAPSIHREHGLYLANDD